jgi:acetoacetate decarboxylase
MRKEDVLKLPSMPAAGPSYPAGPYRFINREFLVITYETDPELIRAGLPEPLQPLDQPIVHYEWIKMPDSSGFGSYTESGLVIPARFNGEDVNFVSQMYLDDDPPIAAGREIWGFPKKYAHPKLEVVKDTLTGTLEYSGQLVAMGTMGYKHESMAGNGEMTRATLSKTQINLKLIPGVDGRAEVCQRKSASSSRSTSRTSTSKARGSDRAASTWCRMSMHRSPTFRSSVLSARTISSPI